MIALGDGGGAALDAVGRSRTIGSPGVGSVRRASRLLCREVLDLDDFPVNLLSPGAAFSPAPGDGVGDTQREFGFGAFVFEG